MFGYKFKGGKVLKITWKDSCNYFEEYNSVKDNRIQGFPGYSE